MPTYVYKCKVCPTIRDVIKKLADIDRPEVCDHCAAPMERKICAPAVAADYPGYECPVSGKWIEGRRAHEENLKRTGCRIYEPGETQQQIARKAAEDEAFFDSVADTAASLVAQMPAEKQERLANELAAGADISYSRN